MAEQNRVNDFMDKWILGPLGAFSEFKLVRAIANTGMGSISFTIVGSAFLVINVIPQAFPALSGLYAGSFDRVTDLYMLVNKATMGALALYFNILLGYNLTEIFHDEEKLDLNPLNGALLSMMAFFITLPELVLKDGVISLMHIVNDQEGQYIVNGWEMGGDGVSRLGTVGIFTAILMAVLAVYLYRLCVAKKWTIKMPAAVPSGVANSFTALIPAFVIAFAVILINGLLVMAGYDIFKIVSIPFGFLVNMTNTWIGAMIIYFFIQALWFVGIHGATIVGSIITPIGLANLTANVAGGHIPLAGDFGNAFVTLGGSGATLGLCIWLATRAKSAQLSAIGKAAVAPAIFNINEPLIFGIPFLYNVDMIIPWFLAPMASTGVAYFAISTQIVRPVIVQMAWPTPAGLGAFISTGGDWKASVLAILCALVAFLVYWPFIRRYDRKLLAEEQAAEAELNA